jgi:hypothetical protein
LYVLVDAPVLDIIDCTKRTSDILKKAESMDAGDARDKCLEYPEILDTFMEEAYQMHIMPKGPSSIKDEECGFEALFGVPPVVCFFLYRICDLNDTKPKHILWTLLFLKHYKPQLYFKVRTNKEIYYEWVWAMVERLHHIWASFVADIPLENNDPVSSDLHLKHLTSWNVISSHFWHGPIRNQQCFQVVAAIEKVRVLLTKE